LHPDSECPRISTPWTSDLRRFPDLLVSSGSDLRYPEPERTGSPRLVESG
jgi:hypothetical protein